ncbi:MAG: hypothetical protein N2645_14975 [Clostridia bacterium]|nr:hypothetical protein [Clostridia bacterium]
MSSEDINVLKNNIILLQNKVNDLSQMLVNANARAEKAETEKRELAQKLSQARPVEEFYTLQINRQGTSLKYILYFKEYSHPLYFNTFFKFLCDVLLSLGKAKILIMEQMGSRINMKRYDLSYLIVDSSTDAATIMEKDKIVLFETRVKVLELLCENRSGHEILVVYDKMGFDKELLAGFKVYRLNVIRDDEDVKLFNLSVKQCISNDIEGALLNLTELERFKGISNEDIRRMIYKRQFIDGFLEALEGMIGAGSYQQG